MLMLASTLTGDLILEDKIAEHRYLCEFTITFADEEKYQVCDLTTTLNFMPREGMKFVIMPKNNFLRKALVATNIERAIYHSKTVHCITLEPFCLWLKGSKFPTFSDRTTGNAGEFFDFVALIREDKRREFQEYYDNGKWKPDSS